MPATAQRLILLELNELTPSLMERFIAEGKLPNFARFKGESKVFTSEAAERSPTLEPWIQWVTVHTGLNFDEHKLFHLNEGHRLAAKRIWDVASEAGLTSLVCGSMNVGESKGLEGWVIPDPWCTEVPPTPELATYFRFVQKNVLEYSNDRVPLTRADKAAFLWFLARRGLSGGRSRASSASLPPNAGATGAGCVR